jgi:hypothetical protein
MSDYVEFRSPLREWLRKVEDLTKLRGVSAAVKTFAFVGGGMLIVICCPFGMEFQLKFLIPFACTWQVFCTGRGGCRLEDIIFSLATVY